jgi:hypothetical protein
VLGEQLPAAACSGLTATLFLAPFRLLPLFAFFAFFCFLAIDYSSSIAAIRV